MNNLPWQNIDSSPATRKKALIFATCLIFSFVSWLFIKLTRESAAEVPVKISITDIPEDILFTAQSDSTFSVNIQSTGLKLLSSRFLRSTSVLQLDFSALQQIKRNNNNYYYVTASQAVSRLSLITEIPRHAIRVMPDTVFFASEKAFQKKVPIILEKEIDFRPGFKLYDIPVLLPDSVWVSGPEALRDSVMFFRTKTLKANKVDQGIRATIALVNPWKSHHVLPLQTSVEAFIPVEEFTESTFELTLQLDCPELSGKTAAGDLLLFPDKVAVYYLVALKDDKTITPDMFSAFVLCPDTLAGGAFRLKTEIRDKPALVDIIRLRPQEVEYLWIKK